MRVDGFRKGHVPAHIIEQRFGASIRQDVLNDLLPRHFLMLLLQKKLILQVVQLLRLKLLKKVKILYLLQLLRFIQKLNYKV